ncbi:hypothetical protein RMATCC62417_00517 [Rhizopus microsporus]|nr:hypothetical protein RMATCC62417_00517 [Rhizopus microsporus]
MHSPSDVYRSGAIFALYFLYHSQPQVWKKVPIRVDKDTWSRLFDFYAESIKHDKNIEAALIFDKLRSQNAFSFTAEQVFDPTSIQEREEFKDARLILDKLHALHIENIKNDTLAKCLDTDTYNAILSKYSDAKRKALATPQLTVVTQAMMKEKLRIRETKPARLRNFMTNTGMIDDTSISVNLPKQSIVQSKIREMTTKQRQRKVQWEIKRTLAEEKLYNQRNDENEMVQVQGNESSDIMDDSLIG